MTARVTTLKGADAGAYYVEALPSYYLDTGEPRGLWHGRGAELLGLAGEVGDREFLDVMAGLHPRLRDGVKLGRGYGDGSVRGFDVTASAPKSVSVLFAVGDDHTRDQVVTAHDTAVATMLDWVEAHAHTRYRIRGEVAVVDAEGIIAATFRQHTSRALDPQLHTHTVIANRVRSDDGRWLALDARSLKLDQRTVSAIFHATLRSELTTRLGVQWRPVVNGIAEIDHVPEAVLEEFSARTADIQRRIDEKLDRFTDTFDRDPTPRERWRLEREAVVDSRPAKSHDISARLLHGRWHAQLEALGHDPAAVVAASLRQVHPRGIDELTALEAIERALSSLSDRQSTWRPAELTREIAAALPTDAALDPEDLIAALDRLTQRAIDDGCVDISRPVPDGAIIRGDGRPVTESVADRALTTGEILHQEERLMAWAERRLTLAVPDAAAAIDRTESELTAPQAETAAAVAGNADLVVVVGPAGTGKTTAVAPAVAHLQAQGRAVFGVAPSATAADVLAAETGIAADTVDKLVTEHRLARPPDHRYDLPAGATVIVDEAAMLPTDRLDQLAHLADTRGWRIALVGDPMQFSAVGRGGMFAHIVDTHGAIELDTVHRFTHPWERAASLQLRGGDPVVADLYDRYGRLHGGTATRMETEAIAAWWQARQARQSVALSAPTTDTVDRLNQRAQQLRIDNGEIDTNGLRLAIGASRLHVGDEIVTRRNHRRLRTDQNRLIHNRDHWTIKTIHRDGAITAHGRTGTVRLPTHYVADHVELGYTQTSHATQGRTVDRSILLLDSPTDVRGLYVPMTRGRHRNDAYIVTTAEQTAVDIFAEAIGRSWIDQPALARRDELAGQHPHRPGTLPAPALRKLFDQQAQLTNHLARLADELHHLPFARQIAEVDRARVTARLDRSHDRLQEAFDTLARHDRPFHRRRHQIEITNARHALEHLPETVATLAGQADELTRRLHGIDQQLERAQQLDQRRPTMEAHLADITDHLDQDRHIRSRAARHEEPAPLIGALGHRPRGRQRGQIWDTAAGRLDQHRAAYGTAADRPGTGPGHDHSLDLVKTASRQLAAATRHQRPLPAPSAALTIDR